MNSTFDAQMRRVYAPLNRDHDRLRAELMASLPEGVPHGPDEPLHPNRPHWTGWLIMKRRVLPLAVAAAAAVTLIVGIWPGPRGDGLAWADVVRQLQTAGTAHLRMTIKDPGSYGGKEVTQDMYIKRPGMLRCEGIDPQSGKQKVVIVNGEKTVVLFPEEKRHDAVAGPIMPAGWLDDMLRLLGGRQGTQPAQGGPVEGPASWQWTPLGPAQRDGRTLNKFRIEIPGQETSDSNVAGAFCWVDPGSSQVVLLTHERTVDGKRVEVQRNEVELNTELPDELFSTAVPAGYRSDVQTTLAVGEVVRKYEQATSNLPRYRLILWKNGRPAERGARDGLKMFREEGSSSGLKPDAAFEEVWGSFRRADVAVSEHARGGRVTRVLWSEGKPRHVYDQGSFDPEDDKVAELGWPHFAGSLLWATFTRKATFRLLPPDLRHPGLIGVQYACVELDSTDRATMQIHWLDPARDYLCIYRESHQRKSLPWVKNSNWQPDEPLTTTRPEGSIHEHDSVHEILECAQSPHGKWYPTLVRQSGASLVDGKRHLWGPVTIRLQLDFTGPLPESLFDHPPDLPERGPG